MKNKDPALWATFRIHQILSQAHLRLKANSLPLLSDLISEQHILEQYSRMFDKAQARGWTHSIDILQTRLISQIASVQCASRNVHPPRLADVPAITDILGEIRCLSDEFDQVEILPKEKRIDVITDEITLEDINLGAFCIELDFDRLARRRDVSAFRVVAQDPNPASSDESCTHPHIRNKELCAGDATLPISHALAEGRIGDAFQLINRVLHTYNGGSAYVSLSDWESRSCSDCGNATPSESLCPCEHCDGDFCDDCMLTCDRCDQSVCMACSGTNKAGERLCPRCKKLDKQESEEADEEEQTPVSVDPIHDATEEEPQPQPSTETIHEHTHSHSPQTQPPGVELPGGTADGDQDARVVSVHISPPQAA